MGGNAPPSLAKPLDHLNPAILPQLNALGKHVAIERSDSKFEILEAVLASTIDFRMRSGQKPRLAKL
jgi:hypothetical protein